MFRKAGQIGPGNNDTQHAHGGGGDGGGDAGIRDDDGGRAGGATVRRASKATPRSSAESMLSDQITINSLRDSHGHDDRESINRRGKIGRIRNSSSKSKNNAHHHIDGEDDLEANHERGGDGNVNGTLPRLLLSTIRNVSRTLSIGKLLYGWVDALVGPYDHAELAFVETFPDTHGHGLVASEVNAFWVSIHDPIATYGPRDYGKMNSDRIDVYALPRISREDALRVQGLCMQISNMRSRALTPGSALRAGMPFPVSNFMADYIFTWLNPAGLSERTLALAQGRNFDPRMKVTMCAELCAEVLGLLDTRAENNSMCMVDGESGDGGQDVPSNRRAPPTPTDLLLMCKNRFSAELVPTSTVLSIYC